MIKLALDMMGSDLGPEELSKSVVEYVKAKKDVSLLCFGQKEKLTSLEGIDRVKIIDCKQVVPMEIGSLQLLRMKESSLMKACKAVKDGEADGIVSAGSSGGLITAATLLLKNIEGVERAGFCAPFITAKNDKQVVILDIGASNENSPTELVGFAKLGTLYAKDLLKVKKPAVYLLSNGAEEGKGTDEIKQAYKLLEEEKDLNFMGNCEARDALDGNKDVVVTSGFPGNIFLKATEGTAALMNAMLKKAFKRNFLSKLGYLFAKKGFVEMKKSLDYRKIGGAIFIGVNGVVVKAHGSSNSEAFFHAIDLGYRMVESNFVNDIRKEFKKENA